MSAARASDRGETLDDTSRERRALHSPFLGLRSFTASDEDAALFFGRDRDQELILANLLASRLTLLYGQSGIGKSSLLCAGIVSHLRRTREDAGAVLPSGVVVYVNEWSSDPGAAILGELREQARTLTGDDRAPSDPDMPLAQALEWWGRRLQEPILLILDQFEQYCLRHAPAQTREFDRGLAAAIERQSVRLRCLISLRADMLSELDRFEAHMPNLFANLMRLDGLGPAAALQAIHGPVERINEWRGSERPAVELEAGLAETVVRELQHAALPLSHARANGSFDGDRLDGEPPIEPAHLQLVMDALWVRETASGSRSLRLSTLADLGGCAQIVRSHLEANLSGLPAGDRTLAARAIYYLVTPSGLKVAYTAADLAGYLEVTEARVAAMLERLCAVRIMRPLPPAEGSHERRYEAFHDLLAAPLLAWRASFEARRLAMRMRWALAALSAAVAAALAIVAYTVEPAPLNNLELASLDARFAVRGSIAADRDIVIVDVDARTLRALDRGSLPTALRPYYAKLIDSILTGAPKAIAVDVEFHTYGNERNLLAAIKRADGRIVLVSELFNNSGEVPLFGREEEGGATSLLAELNHAHAGFGGLPREPDGVYRRMVYTAPALDGTPENRLLSFAVTAAQIAERHAIPRFTGSTLIDYHGPTRTFANVSMLDVLEGRVSPARFRGKLVLIGVTAPGKDHHRTPLSAGMPGVEVQANAISTVRHGPSLSSAGAAIASLLAVALSLAALAVAPMRRWGALGVFSGVAVAYLLLAQLAFDAGVYLPVVTPLLALVLAGVGTVLARAFLARQERARVHA
jgi:CHASE2 domain-containing sensor protein